MQTSLRAAWRHLALAGSVLAFAPCFAEPSRAGDSGPPSVKFEILHRFDGLDGSDPRGRLIQASDGRLWGTTASGGERSQGTVFRMTHHGKFSLRHVLDDGAKEGRQPHAGLVQGPGGNFYGVTYDGGPHGYGTIFGLTPFGKLTTLHSFAPDDGDGRYPRGELVLASDGMFYGTTSSGGSGGGGVIFRIAPDGSGYSILHSFSGPPFGSQPNGLIQATDGHFYGTTVEGGPLGVGTVFKMAPDGTVTILHSFDRFEDDHPYAGLLQARDGRLYGSTLGTIFRIDTDGNGYTVLHSFVGGHHDGNHSRTPLIQGPDGNFYGTTFLGGRHDKGTVFKMTRAGKVTVLHSFAFNGKGAHPEAPLLLADDGWFYGTTTTVFGTVYRFKPRH